MIATSSRQWLLATLMVLSMPVALADTTIVIVRHGEKPPAGLGQLSCQGLNRALALPEVLLAKFGSPVAIYAPNPAIQKEDKGVAYAHVRPLATIEPLAIQAGLPVNVQWGMTETSALAQHLVDQANGTQVVAWEHHWGEALARTLIEKAAGDVLLVPNWDDADFDSVYVVRLRMTQGRTTLVSFSHDREGLNDRSTNCPH